ncbi:MAG: YhcH/YjgK/YiaL family protein [Acutalibacteraceae bacterium]|nr:YhcH/YjgK/YiaL family protein [Acutalibacteraceae bacterium]
MIYDTAKNLRLYSSFNPAFEAIAKFVEENDLKNMPCDSYDVAEGIRVSISEYEPNTGGNYEAHRDYHDLQFAITGEEAIDVLPIEFAENSTGYKPDIEFFTSQTAAASRVALTEGTFVFLAPADTHKPCIKMGTDKIKKAVFKIKI